MKQILIQSESNDGSTDDVLSWIYHLDNKIAVNRLFDYYVIENISLQMSNENKFIGTINNVKIDNTINTWYRRGRLKNYIDNAKDYWSIHGKVREETIQPVIEFLEGDFSNNQINKFKDNFTGKLEMLYQCLSLNIKIPDILITGDSLELMSFILNHKKVITKPIKNPFINFYQENYKIKFSTQSKLIMIEDIPCEKFDFMPSFFQKYIEKKYEIRTFYMKGVFKSMAIFSQQNEKTKIDFRNYDHKRPNRCVPYQLPLSLESKLQKLMTKLNLNCGSLDIICTPENEYYFLEVNPIGQFQWLSRHCNYYLERLIAKKITNNE